MISGHSIKASVVFLLIVYVCVQISIYQVKRSRLSPLIKYSDECNNRTILPVIRKVIEQDNCTGPVKLLRGHLKHRPVFLTIGLCTVPRPKASYLLDTIHSLMHHMTNEEKQEVVIVVFLGFHQESDVNVTVKMIENSFNDSLSTGGLQVIQPDIRVYPDFKKLSKRTFNDDLKRVHWRTKQNIDFAHLFGYSEGLSKYYMHMEDDLDAIPNYITEIKSVLFKQEQSRYHWFVLNFGEGFYGQLFRSRDLCMMKKYFLLFQDQKPCDMLLQDLKQIQLHDFKNVKEFKGKFKHRGKYSSLEGKYFKASNDTIPQRG